ncbi:MAG: hypothetical protein PHE43_00255 [Candidatus Nanoarchaeia archaeon]|nr:hypothetical protein [Candidatus Nanoarchaeia archaeon]
MSQISKDKIERIKQDILYLLYDLNLKPIYTKDLANEVIRDDEFILRLLLDMEKEGLVKQVDKNNIRRKQWIMTNEAYDQFRKMI